jgi:hypothetical protein
MFVSTLSTVICTALFEVTGILHVYSLRQIMFIDWTEQL